MQLSPTIQTGCALVRPYSHTDAEMDVPGEAGSFGALQDAWTAPAQPYALGPRITCVDRAIIRRYFDEHQSPSVADFTRERAASSPGTQTWVQGERLATAVHSKRLPPGLEYKLSILKLGYERVLVGSDVLLIESSSRAIVDAMQRSGVAEAALTPVPQAMNHG